jgi:hypothetical protein
MTNNKVMKKILFRLFGIIVILILASLWIILNPKPAFAQINTINYNNINLENRDFSHPDLAGVTFVAAEMRGANFQSANLSNAILTKGVLLKANLEGANLTGASAVLGNRMITPLNPPDVLGGNKKILSICLLGCCRESRMRQQPNKALRVRDWERDITNLSKFT